MKIVAGLGSIDEYIKFAEAGADVPVKVLRRQEYIVQGLEKLAKEEK